jgi:uncharacterized membrane protein
MTAARLTRLPDDDLGRAIGHLDVRWPVSPDVAGSVIGDIQRGRAPRRRIRRTTVVILVAAAVLALAVAAGAATFLVRIGGIAIRSVPAAPTLPTSPVEPRIVGHRVSVERAEEALGGPLPTPAALGTPDVVWLRRELTSFEPMHHGIVAAMAWRPTPHLPRIPGTPYGATLFVFRGDEVVAIKSVEAPMRQLRRYGATWIDAPHQLDLLVDGDLRSFRVDGTVLIWRHGELVHRLETALGRRPAAHLAFAGT